MLYRSKINLFISIMIYSSNIWYMSQVSGNHCKSTTRFHNVAPLFRSIVADIFFLLDNTCMLCNYADGNTIGYFINVFKAYYIYIYIYSEIACSFSIVNRDAQGFYTCLVWGFNYVIFSYHSRVDLHTEITFHMHFPAEFISLGVGESHSE